MLLPKLGDQEEKIPNDQSLTPLAAFKISPIALNLMGDCCGPRV
jgi:hypothetical protein